MFVSAWSWIVPLLAAALVFVGVLLTTPPGFGAISNAVFFAPRGPGDAAAYALGAAASLALATLVILGVACCGLDLALRKMLRRSG